MFKIAIDGPAGAGKSTISQQVAKRLNFEYIDTGAMYRAITLKAMALGIDMENEEEYDFLKDTVLDVKNGRIHLDTKDVSDEIRTVAITNNVSIPSRIGIVRSFLVDYQRKISDSKNVVMDGRDIGTVVLPDADLKIYLDAAVECRAIRRKLEREEQGITLTLEETIAEIDARDYKDSHRAISPLKKADDAITIDSSDMTIDEVVERIIFLVYERGFTNMNKANYYEGQKVNARIVNVTKDAIYLELPEGEKAVIYSNDIDGFSEGTRLNSQYNEGGEFTANIKQISKDRRTNEPLYILSTKLEKEREKFVIFEELKERDEIFTAKVVRVTRAGADLVYNDLKLFLPIRQIDLSEDALKGLLKQNIEVLILNVDRERMSVIVSHSLAMRKKNRLAKEAALASLNEGDVVNGVVTNILAFGAIISLGEVSGLLHQSEMDYKMVRNINDYVKLGQEITVKIIKIEDGKIGLSLKALREHPWDVLKSKYQVDDVFEGIVDKIIPAGLIIRMTPEYAGLMPRSEYSWLINERLDNNVQEGDSIKVKVLAIDDEKKRISLSHRATTENAWGSIKLHKGDRIEVMIASTEEKGAKVTYLNVTGFMPISEITATRRINKVEEFFVLGQTIEVVVIEFDAGRAKLIVSAKALEVAKERESFDKYFEEQKNETPISTIGDAFKDLGFLDDSDKE